MYRLLIFFVLQTWVQSQVYNSPWHFKCANVRCNKYEITPEVRLPKSLEVCQLLCGDAGALWPKPTGSYSLGTSIKTINPKEVWLNLDNPKSKVGKLLIRKIENFRSNFKNLKAKSPTSSSVGLHIIITGLKNYDDAALTLGINEGYTLNIRPENSSFISVTISGETYFGVRNALETLSQLIAFNDLTNEYQMLTTVSITDAPVYPYRGILLDTSRNYIDKKTILKTLEAMGMSKLNTFHWHITDSPSFPYESRTWPNMSRYGAYSPEKVYTAEDVKEIVEAGIFHGVRVIPELDAPAHVGEGWQWVGDDSVVCFRAEPYYRYCAGPPCGNLNPTSEKVYEVLQGLYKDMMEDFKPEIFHMGGDEVRLDCWQSSESIKNWMRQKNWGTSKDDYMKLWSHFQTRAHEKLQIANGGKDIKAVLWTSTLTDDSYLRHLDPQKYIIQIWTDVKDRTIKRLLKNNFQVIFSNYDALYLDCGFGAWIGAGNGWCSPYKNWQKIYDNSPLQIARSQGVGNKKHLILGGEAALWTEIAGSASVDNRLWPRSAAMAERLWAEPGSGWQAAEHRLILHRERLVKRGIFSDTTEPEWCQQNQGHCN
ncbi:GSCOCT00010351001.2-RA-CDS [Cotesia congregata]|uniref:Beta-hexosaminidase n=1 Tax=Cotesia congregata TaxID=51543 RepID=A0A8J2H7Q0_COTCN|nr:GSCOCT00010351001.2-RA-CDS [Cotesia congregata]CAG5079006.1 Putative venom protein 17 [Cotesia congregata]